MHQSIEVGEDTLAGTGARVRQHIFDDRRSPLAMLADFLEVLLQSGQDFALQAGIAGRASKIAAHLVH